MIVIVCKYKNVHKKLINKVIISIKTFVIEHCINIIIQSIEL